MFQSFPVVHWQVLIRGHSDNAATPAVIDTLNSIAQSSKGAQAVIKAGALDVLDELLKSPNISVRKLTCTLLNTLAGHDLIIVTLLNGIPYQRLMLLLQ